MNYKAVFKLDNGIEGEVKLTAKNDGDAFMTGCKMFAMFGKVDFELIKMESVFYPKEALNKALHDIELAEEQVDMTLDYEKGGDREELDESEIEYRLTEAKEQFAYAKEHIQEALKQLA